MLFRSCQYALFEVEKALDGILCNFPIKSLGFLFRAVVFPTGRWLRLPDDKLVRKVAKLLQTPSASRDRLTHGIYINESADDITGCLEHALKLTLQVDPIRKRLREADRRQADHQSFSQWTDSLQQSGHLDTGEVEQLVQWNESILTAISVDDFEQATVTN